MLGAVSATEPTYRRPESVLVVVYTRAGDCLVLERVEPRGFWQSVTGTLQWDETPAAAAVRELREETGLAAAGLRDAGVTRSFPILPAWRDRYAPDVERNVEHRWYLALDARAEIALNPAEHAQYVWLPFDEAIARVSSWTNREAIEYLHPSRGRT
jgi:dATP pyrophosphohydrolase